MTVKELIDKLGQHPEHANIDINCPDCGSFDLEEEMIESGGYDDSITIHLP